MSSGSVGKSGFPRINYRYHGLRQESDAKEFIIGTENSIVQHLQYECPDKKFYPLSKDCVCHNMKLTTLGDVYHCLLGDGGEEIALDEKVMKEAGRCINTMLTLGQ